jgi:hypothetical protein
VSECSRVAGGARTHQHFAPRLHRREAGPRDLLPHPHPHPWQAILAQQQAQQQAQQAAMSHPRTNSEDLTNATPGTVAGPPGDAKAGPSAPPSSMVAASKVSARSESSSSRSQNQNPKTNAQGSPSPSYYGEGVIGAVGGTFFNSIFRPQSTKTDSSIAADTELESNRANVIRLKQVPEKMKSAERTTGAER